MRHDVFQTPFSLESSANSQTDFENHSVSDNRSKPDAEKQQETNTNVFTMSIATMVDKPLKRTQYDMNEPKNGLYIFGSLGTAQIKLLIDTGASISVMSKQVYDSIPEGFKPKIQHSDTVLVTVDGTKVTSKGKILLPIQVGSIQVIEEFIISDSVTECILGMPILKSAGFQLDLKNMAINVNSEWIPVYDRKGISLCCRVTIDKTVTIPANHEMILSGMINFRGPITPEPYLLEPSKQFMSKHGVFVGKVLVNSDKSSVPLRMYNPQDEPIVLYKGSTVGVVSPVDSIIEELPNEDIEEQINHVANDSGEITVPEHLQDLWKRGSEHITKAESIKLAELLIKYQHVFSTSDSDIGQTDLTEHDIVTTDQIPIKQPPRRLPKCSEEEVDRQVQDLLAREKITCSSSPWSSPIVLVAKKDGTKRLCVDYRKLNDKTVKDAYVIPVINNMLSNLSGASWFNTFDLSSGYWQVKMSEGAKLKSAFCTRQGLFQWDIMPFGLTNAPGTFQRLMDRVLAGLSWKIAMVYLDDIIVIGKSVDECLINMGQVFERLSKAGLKLKPKKCFILQKHVKYLGYIVSDAGIQTDPEKVDKVLQWPEPENISELRSLLGLASYYRRHLPQFATVCKPLYKLCEKGQEFIINDDCKAAILKIKELLTQAPILAYPVEKGEYILDTDASQTGIGAVLSQVQDGQEKVIAYSSRTLSKAERQYCVTRQELLAIVYHVRHFKEFVYGVHFTIRTDHGSLRWLSKFKDIDQGQMARWMQILSEYNYSIVTRPGKASQNADSLSRRPPCSGKKCICQSLQQSKNSPIIDCHCNTKDIGTQTDNIKSKKLSAKVIRKVSEVSKLWTTEEMIKAQKEDLDIGPIVEFKLNQNNKPTWEQVSNLSSATKALWSSWEKLFLKSDMLYRKWETLNGKKFHYQLVLPKVYQNPVLKQLHDSPTSGHMGSKRTLFRVKTRFYWYRMKTDVQTWVRTCIPCQAKETHGSKARARLKQYVVGNRWERIATDICGPFPRSSNKNKYILVVTDYFTKFTEAYAVPNIEAETVANKFVKEWICRYGCPMQLHSDQGSNYQSALFIEVCKLLGIEQTRTSPYHPQSDGQAEKFMSTLKKMITKLVENHESEGDWEDVLPYVLMAYNSSINDTTKATPNSLVFGDEIALPIDLATEPPTDQEKDQNIDSYAQYILDLGNKFWEGHHRARECTQSAMVHQKRYYDRNKSNKSIYNRGSLVWLHNPKRILGKTPKLQNPWEGPYVIIKPLSDVTFRIQKNLNSKPKIIHYNRLKPFHAREPPNLKWLEKVPETEPTEELQPEDLIDESEKSDNTKPTDYTISDHHTPMEDESQSQIRPKRQIKKPKKYGEWDYGINLVRASQILIDCGIF